MWWLEPVHCPRSGLSRPRLSRPIRGQRPGHVITLDQSEPDSISRTVLPQRDTSGDRDSVRFPARAPTAWAVPGCLGWPRKSGSQPSQSPEYNTQIHTTSLLTPRRCIKERAKKIMTKPNCILSIYFLELSPLSGYSYSCHYPMRFLDKSENRGCSVTVLDSTTIYFALSFIHLLDSRSDLSVATLTLPALDVIRSINPSSLSFSIPWDPWPIRGQYPGHVITLDQSVFHGTPDLAMLPPHTGKVKIEILISINCAIFPVLGWPPGCLGWFSIPTCTNFHSDRSSLWLVASDHVTRILASDWSLKFPRLTKHN